MPSEVYRERAEELQAIRRGLELRVSEAGRDDFDPIVQVRDLAAKASSARVRFQEAAKEDRLEVLSALL